MLVPMIDAYDTIDELETALGLPAGSVAATLERYNKMAAAGEDLDLHKGAEWLAPQDTGRGRPSTCARGTRCTPVSPSAASGSPSTAGPAPRRVGHPRPVRRRRLRLNIAQDGKGYCSGTQLGEGSFFGRQAGRAARCPDRVSSAGR